MKLYGAIDLHSTNNVTVMIDEQDQVIYQKRLPNDLTVIVQQLSAYQASLQGRPLSGIIIRIESPDPPKWCNQYSEA
jgi:hypothetical protein